MELCETPNRFGNKAVQLTACGVGGELAEICIMWLLRIADRINLWQMSWVILIQILFLSLLFFLKVQITLHLRLLCLCFTVVYLRLFASWKLFISHVRIDLFMKLCFLSRLDSEVLYGTPGLVSEYNLKEQGCETPNLWDSSYWCNAWRGQDMSLLQTGGP